MNGIVANTTVDAGGDRFAMVVRDPFTCRCGGAVAIGFMPDEPGAGAILHTLPACPPYDRLGIRDFYDYLRSGREPAPIAASGETPRPPKGKR